MADEVNPGMTLTESLIQGIVERYECLSQNDIRKSAGRSLYDFVICAISGQKTVLELFEKSDLSGTSTIIGTQWRTHSSTAAARNAVAAAILDRDDLHWPSVTHLGSIIWPVVLAIGEEVNAPGQTALKAAVVGYETASRLALALGEIHRRYWHVTTTTGMIGAAVAASFMIENRVTKAAIAANHAISVAGGFTQCYVEKSGTRFFHRAHAVRTAIDAAKLASAGLSANRYGLEGEKGLFAATTGSHGLEHLLDISACWAIQELTFRFYGSSGFTHAAIEAALKLSPVLSDSVQNIYIDAPAITIINTNNPNPATMEEAWWSLQYAVAVCLNTGDYQALDKSEFLYDPRVRNLLQKIELIPRKTYQPDDVSTSIRIVSDHAEKIASCVVPKGNPLSPLNDQEIKSKWQFMQPDIKNDVIDKVFHLLTNSFADIPIRELMKELGKAIQ